MPAPRVSRATLLEEAAFAVEGGLLTPPDVARQLGMSETALYQGIYRAARDGDPTALRLHRTIFAECSRPEILEWRDAS